MTLEPYRPRDNGHTHTVVHGDGVRRELKAGLVQVSED